jgi:fatty acid desaturase
VFYRADCQEYVMRLMRYDDGLWPNLAALGYAITAYAVGWALLLGDGLIPFIAGVPLLAHGMVIAAYLLHECAHNTVFLKNEWNARLGRVLMWLTGACYGSYEEIRHKHFRHHVDRSDVTPFDYRRILNDRPWLLTLIRWLEWWYIPAVEILMHALLIVLPFVTDSRRHMRVHVTAVLAIRAIIFSGIFAVAPVAIVGYGVAYLMFMTVLRFMDAFQHTYDIVEARDGETLDRRDRDYEHHNTYSNPVSLRHPWLNLLTLNFAYHNAHHTKPTVPWYRLPRFNQECFGEDRSQIIPFREQLRMFHCFRLRRIMSEEVAVPDSTFNKGVAFVGVDGVSFLTTQ